MFVQHLTPARLQNSWKFEKFKMAAMVAREKFCQIDEIHCSTCIFVSLTQPLKYKYIQFQLKVHIGLFG